MHACCVGVCLERGCCSPPHHCGVCKGPGSSPTAGPHSKTDFSPVSTSIPPHTHWPRGAGTGHPASHVPGYLQGWRCTECCLRPERTWQWSHPSRQASCRDTRHRYGHLQQAGSLEMHFRADWSVSFTLQHGSCWITFYFTVSGSVSSYKSSLSARNFSDSEHQYLAIRRPTLCLRKTKHKHTPLTHLYVVTLTGLKLV